MQCQAVQPCKILKMHNLNGEQRLSGRNTTRQRRRLPDQSLQCGLSGQQHRDQLGCRMRAMAANESLHLRSKCQTWVRDVLAETKCPLDPGRKPFWRGDGALYWTVRKIGWAEGERRREKKRREQRRAKGSWSPGSPPWGRSPGSRSSSLTDLSCSLELGKKGVE